MTEDIRYGVIGTGMMGVEHIHNLRALDGARVTAVSDPDADSRATAVDGRRRRGRRSSTDHRELLGSGRCDAVVVASPNMTHVDVLLDVLDHDVHVLVEKPLVHDGRGLPPGDRGSAEGRDALRVGRPRVPLHAAGRPSGRRGRARARSGTLHMLAIREHRFPFLAKVGDWNRFNRNTGRHPGREVLPLLRPDEPDLRRAARCG